MLRVVYTASERAACVKLIQMLQCMINKKMSEDFSTEEKCSLEAAADILPENTVLMLMF